MELTKNEKTDYFRAVSGLTGVPKVILEDIDKATLNVISHDICAQNEKDKVEYKVLLGTLGELSVYKINGELLYNFEPSDTLKNAIANSIDKSKDLAVECLEKELIISLTKRFKELVWVEN